MTATVCWNLLGPVMVTAAGTPLGSPEMVTSSEPSAAVVVTLLVVPREVPIAFEATSRM